MKPEVTVLVCTYNREKLLAKTLESLVSQEYPPGKYEILVVDNASKDNTREVVESYKNSKVTVRYLYEPILGVAVARNAGAREARADVIAYFDDDQIATPDCLGSLTTPFYAVTPTPAAVMGRVDLDWEGGKPSWYPDAYESLLSRYDKGEQSRFLRADEYLLTMNVAFRKKVFLEIGGIREDLSRIGRMFICSGDNDVFRRLVGGGHGVYYEPGAIVRHWVPLSRQKRMWLVKRVFGEGTSIFIMNYSGARKYLVLRRFSYDFRVGIALLCKALFKLLLGAPLVATCLPLVRNMGMQSAEIQYLMDAKVIKTFSE